MSSRHLLVIGLEAMAGGLVEVVLGQGYAVTLAREAIPAGRYDLVLAEVASAESVPSAARDGRCPWVAWCTGDDPGLLAAAYGAGALAALPPTATVEMVVAAVERASKLALARRAAPRVARYSAGDPIELADDALLTVLDGIVAQFALHEDGAEVLLGLWGAQEYLLGHPSDACCLELRAHTTVSVRLQSWHEARTNPEVVDGLSRRLRRSEAWSSMQARPNMEQRLAGILSLLAEQFGVEHPRGRRLDLRITHFQLAAAIGANRATVTRLIGRLRRRGDLLTTDTEHGERLVWCRPDVCDHGDPVYASSAERARSAGAAR